MRTVWEWRPVWSRYEHLGVSQPGYKDAAPHPQAWGVAQKLVRNTELQISAPPDPPPAPNSNLHVNNMSR